MAFRLDIIILIGLYVASTNAQPGDESCQTDEDCVVRGKCLALDNGFPTNKSCFCPQSCPKVALDSCQRDEPEDQCLWVNAIRLCPSSRTVTCSRRNFQITDFTVTALQPRIGDTFAFTCCINADPHFVEQRWVHNGTHEVPSTDQRGRCWTLTITAADYHHFGNYTCSIRWMLTMKETTDGGKAGKVLLTRVAENERTVAIEAQRGAIKGDAVVFILICSLSLVFLMFFMMILAFQEEHHPRTLYDPFGLNKSKSMRLVAKDFVRWVRRRIRGKLYVAPILCWDLAYFHCNSREKYSEKSYAKQFAALPNCSTDASLAENAQDLNSSAAGVQISDLSAQELLDYVDAIYVKGYDNDRTYIVSENPTEESAEAFWRMIWEHNVHIVVMLTNLQEKQKIVCAKYWPDTSAVYGSLEVQLTDTRSDWDRIDRSFQISERNTNETVDGSSKDGRQIRQYCFRGWSDYQSLKRTMSWLALLSKVHSQNAPKEAPILVHCCGDMDRPGVFIATQSLLDQLYAEARFNVFGCVSKLRKQSNGMISSLDCYIMIHEILIDTMCHQSCIIDGNEIWERAVELRKPAMEFCPSPSPKIPSAYTYTLLEREHDWLVGSVARAKYIASVEASVNKKVSKTAAITSGLRYTLFMDNDLVPLYILTADPSAETIQDFWRLVSDQNVSVIVTLSEDENSLDATCWPSGVGTVYCEKPSTTITVESEENLDFMTWRTLTISTRGTSLWLLYALTVVQDFCLVFQKDEAQEVSQFIYHDWTPIGATCEDDNCAYNGKCWRHSALVPRHTRTFLDMVDKVLEYKGNGPDRRPVLVHCKDGSERSGLFCAAALVIDELQTDSRVNVFSDVAHLQILDDKIIEDLAQYEFLYEALLDRAESLGLW